MDEFRQVVSLLLCVPTQDLPSHYIFQNLHPFQTLSPLPSPSFLPLPLCLTALVLCGVHLVDLVVEPHVGHGHAVLGQRARLVRADGGRGAESLYGLQVLHQAVLLRHALGSESQTHLGVRRGVGREGAKGDGGERTRR